MTETIIKKLELKQTYNIERKDTNPSLNLHANSKRDLLSQKSMDRDPLAFGDTNNEFSNQLEELTKYITYNEKYKYELIDEKINKILSDINIMNTNLLNLHQSLEIIKPKPKKIISNNVK